MFNGLLRFESCHFKPMGKYYICILGKRLRDLSIKLLRYQQNCCVMLGCNGNNFFLKIPQIFFGTFDEGVMQPIVQCDLWRWTENLNCSQTIHFLLLRCFLRKKAPSTSFFLFFSNLIISVDFFLVERRHSSYVLLLVKFLMIFQFEFECLVTIFGPTFPCPPMATINGVQRLLFSSEVIYF